MRLCLFTNEVQLQSGAVRLHGSAWSFADSLTTIWPASRWPLNLHAGRRAATEDDPLYDAKRSMKKIVTLESTTAERSFTKMTACCRVIGKTIVTVAWPVTQQTINKSNLQKCINGYLPYAGTPIVIRSTRRHGVTTILTVTMMMTSSPFITIHVDHQREDCFLQHRKASLEVPYLKLQNLVCSVETGPLLYGSAWLSEDINLSRL